MDRSEEIRCYINSDIYGTNPANMREDIIIQISNRLRDLRKEKNITLQELSEAAGVSKGMLSQVENSRAIPSLPVLLNLISSLQVDFNDFFKKSSFLPL